MYDPRSKKIITIPNLLLTLIICISLLTVLAGKEIPGRFIKIEKHQISPATAVRISSISPAMLTIIAGSTETIYLKGVNLDRITTISVLRDGNRDDSIAVSSIEKTSGAAKAVLRAGRDIFPGRYLLLVADGSQKTAVPGDIFQIRADCSRGYYARNDAMRCSPCALTYGCGDCNTRTGICVSCPAGRYPSGDGCMDCRPGTYKPGQGARSCDTAPRGCIVPNRGGTSYNQCPAGFTNNSDHTACVQCPSGDTCP